ncbi:MAG: guanylate kinase [Chloroflexi bacterium]|nr:guanylate kinase [Chloroflexota bacterium]
MLAVVSGPAGVGKDALMASLLDGGSFARPLTMTTRAPRPGEVDGVDYRFASRAAFEATHAAGELLERAEVHGQLYGAPRRELRAALATGRDVLLQVDVQGALTLRALLDGALLLFIAPESLDQLEQRLRARPGTRAEELARRLQTAHAELAQQDAFDHVVVNIEGDLEGTAERVRALIAAERVRPGRRAVEV